LKPRTASDRRGPDRREGLGRRLLFSGEGLEKIRGAGEAVRSIPFQTAEEFAGKRWRRRADADL
jgi:hypothetical protein